jgi:hypothetical protein
MSRQALKGNLWCVHRAIFLQPQKKRVHTTTPLTDIPPKTWNVGMFECTGCCMCLLYRSSYTWSDTGISTSSFGIHSVLRSRSRDSFFPPTNCHVFHVRHCDTQSYGITHVFIYEHDISPAMGQEVLGAPQSVCLIQIVQSAWC